MKCPNCGNAELVKDKRDSPYFYKGESTAIPSVTGEFCPARDEVVLGEEESRRVSGAMMDFNKEVNASLVSPDFIANVRKKLALVKLLKVLDRHPELLNEIR